MSAARPATPAKPLAATVAMGAKLPPVALDAAPAAAELAALAAEEAPDAADDAAPEALDIADEPAPEALDAADDAEPEAFDAAEEAPEAALPPAPPTIVAPGLVNRVVLMSSVEVMVLPPEVMVVTMASVV